jgi:hypothetical protein
VIVVLAVIPSTRAVVPLVTALADADLVPFSYLVDDVSLTVTFSPADVSRSKADVDTLLTLPIDPPAAGPERALDPPPPEDAVYAAGVALDEVDVVADVDVLPQPATPIAGAISAAATIHPLLLPAGAAPVFAVVLLCLLRIRCLKVMVGHPFLVSRSW